MGRCKLYSFWDGIILLLIKPNMNLAAMFMPLFSKSYYLGVAAEIIGVNEPYKSSMDETIGNPS